MSSGRRVLILVISIVIIAIVVVVLGWTLTLPISLPRILFAFGAITLTIVSLALSGILIFRIYKERTIYDNIQEYHNKVVIDANGSWVTLESPDMEKLGELVEKVTANIVAPRRDEAVEMRNAVASLQNLLTNMSTALERLGELTEKVTVKTTSTNGHKDNGIVEMRNALSNLQDVLVKIDTTVETSSKDLAMTVVKLADATDLQRDSIADLSNLIGSNKTLNQQIGNYLANLNTIYQQSRDVFVGLSSVLEKMEKQVAEMNVSQRASTGALRAIASEFTDTSRAIQELARPFSAAGMSQLAQQVAYQQRENLVLLNQIGDRLHAQAQAQARKNKPFFARWFWSRRSDH